MFMSVKGGAQNWLGVILQPVIQECFTWSEVGELCGEKAKLITSSFKLEGIYCSVEKLWVLISDFLYSDLNYDD
jgi:hypothetical protein